MFRLPESPHHMTVPVVASINLPLCVCSFSHSLVITGARILGVTVEQALEAYGVYFVKYTADQVRPQAQGGPIHGADQVSTEGNEDRGSMVPAWAARQGAWAARQGPLGRMGGHGGTCVTSVHHIRASSTTH